MSWDGFKQTLDSKCFNLFYEFFHSKFTFDFTTNTNYKNEKFYSFTDSTQKLA